MTNAPVTLPALPNCRPTPPPCRHLCSRRCGLPTVQRITRWVATLITVVLLGLGQAQAAQSLVIGWMVSSGADRSAWMADVISQFADANPDIQITQTVKNQEEYKAGFQRMLETENVDVAFWFAGERLRHVVQQKWVRPIDDPELRSALQAQFIESTVAAVQVNQQLYAMPLSYYGWGMFYRKSLFRRLGLTPPATWAEFIDVGKRLQDAKITPTAVGAGDGWPAAAWFDYLNLRINGIDFHRKLLAGEIRFTHPKVRQVLVQWRELLVQNFFLPETTALGWDSPLPYLYRNQVGMVLMGGFSTAKFPPELADDIGFFPFPSLSTAMPQYEDAPLDIAVLPTRGKNADAANRFLSFLAHSDALNAYNKSLAKFSPLKSFTLREGNNSFELRNLRNAKAIAFFFDRDAKPNLIQPALDAFKTFMRPPFDIDQALRAIDTAPDAPTR
jgi:multiple sugar transport system substrate-binding protein